MPDSSNPVVPTRRERLALRVGGLRLVALSRAPRRWQHRVLRGWQDLRPPAAVAAEVSVEEDVAGGVPVVWLARARAASSGVVVYLHGGAYIGGPTEDEWRWLSEVARRTGMAVAVVLYRMPPGHPFPAALDDATAAVAAIAADEPATAARWVLAGGSAGGGLALATHRALLDRGADGPSGLLLTAPWVDLALAAPELAASEKADGFLRRSWLGWAARLYAAGTPLDDPRLSPLHASFAGFAPAAHLDVGTHDLFLPDVRRLRDKLAAAGVDVTYVEQPGGRHTYPLFLERPEAQATVAAQARWLRRVGTLQRVDERQG